MDVLRCKYASKPCNFQRSSKNDGEFHRLCMFHRQRANDAQRRWHSRQRVENKTQPDGSAPSSPPSDAKRPASSLEKTSDAPPRRRRRLHSDKPANASTIALSDASRLTPFAPVDVTAFELSAVPPSGSFSEEELALLDEFIMEMEEYKPIFDVMVTGYDTLMDTECFPFPELFASF